MKNDRLILDLIKQGRLTANLETGDVFLDGKKKGWVHSSGYVVFEYFHRKKRRIIRCHRVVWIFKSRKLPKHDMEIDHKKGIKTDNRWKELELVTGATNVRRAYKNGLCTTKSNHSNRAENGSFAPYDNQF